MYAKSGQFVYAQDRNFLVLYDGVREEISDNSHQVTEFVKLYFDISLKPTTQNASEKKNKNLSIVPLIKAAQEEKDPSKFVEIYNRIFFPVLNILLAIISASIMLKNYQPGQYYSFNIKVYLINFFVLGYFTLLTKIYQPSLIKIIVSFASFVILTYIYTRRHSSNSI
jgi:lipopolysaccharide export LptBFGC system permease protein LptF